jgi:prepilin-type N-terminal cleavage/methylation domain-containing protein
MTSASPPETVRAGRRRRGMTMTEVLIAIMILGIGMTSLMTLFPLGLMKIREARRNNRSSLLASNVASDLKTRDLLNRYSFAATLNATGLTGGQLFDPWSKDVIALSGTIPANDVIGQDAATTFGIPIVCCYDPLFWSNLAYTQSPAFSNVTQLVRPEFRFGRARGNDLRVVNGAPSAHGLPRLTNIWPALSAPNALPSMGNINAVASIFVSQDDPVFPEFENDALPLGGRQSPILPLVDNAATGAYSLNDWDYSWIFTGKSRDRNVFEGDMVIFNKRQLYVDTDLNGAVTGIAGERVVEGIFGLGVVPRTQNNGTSGYAAGPSRKVLLMWPKADDAERPDIRVGAWIADVTYEPSLSTTLSRFLRDYDGDGRPDAEHGGQRCHWYRVVQRSEVTAPSEANPGFGGNLDNTHEAMVVTVDRPVIAKTLLQQSAGGYVPVHVNAALIAPEVVAVFPITLEGR